MADTTQTIENIKKLLGKNKLSKAIKALKGLITDSDQKDQLIVLEQQYNSLEDSKIKGILTHKQAGIDRNSLTAAILGLLRMYEDQMESTDTTLNENPQVSNNIQDSKNVIPGNITTQSENITIGDQNTKRVIKQGDKSIYIEKNDGPINIS